MKFKSLEELKDGMWTRLANGEVYTVKVYSTEHITCMLKQEYTQALLDMGAEWYPPIPEGYRLATEEDRKGPKPRVYKVCVNADIWAESWHYDPFWGKGFEYIVPEAKPQELLGAIWRLLLVLWIHQAAMPWLGGYHLLPG